jgi:hypothetical protein
LPRAEYTNKVREAVPDRLLDDKMTVEGLRRALARDFCLVLSEGFVCDCLDWKVRQVNAADYRQWTLTDLPVQAGRLSLAGAPGFQSPASRQVKPL